MKTIRAERWRELMFQMEALGIRSLSLAMLEPPGHIQPLMVGSQTLRNETPVTSRTVFEAASLTKPLFAALVMKLVRAGTLALDTPVRHYLPQGQPPLEPWGALDGAHPWFERITPRQLLCHTSGLGNWQPERIACISTPPGSTFAYSGEGYILLQRAVEHVTRQPLQHLAEALIFGPLGMKDSSLVWREDFEDRAAEGQGPRSPFVGRRWNTPAAAYSLFTTACDYARLLRHSLSQPALTEPQVHIDPELGWGLGWGLLRPTSKGTWIWHWGDMGDFGAFVLGQPASGQGLVVLGNAGTTQRLLPEWAPALLELSASEILPITSFLERVGGS